MTAKTLDQKLAILKRDPDAKVFILADAKDADMAFGIGSAGQSPEQHSGEVRFRTLVEYRNIIREIVKQQLVDIMLTSASTNAVLAIEEKLFADSPVTPAARANDTTDIWVVRGGNYIKHESHPFRTASIDQIQCGLAECDNASRNAGANLGLYSCTFNNDLAHDLATLEAYRQFRLEAELKGFDHFLEVFDPNAGHQLPSDHYGSYVNDMIARALAGVPSAGRPRFLKIVYHGPKAMEELHAYDPSLVIGILGGSAGTTYDAFKLLAEAQKYGAKVALYGRKINNAENQFAFIRFLRLIVDGLISPEEAVKAYHGVLQRLGIKPQRELKDDLVLQTGVMSYGGSSTTISLPTTPSAVEPLQSGCGCALPAATTGCACSAKKSASAVGCGCGGDPTKPGGCACASKQKSGESACGCGGAAGHHHDDDGHQHQPVAEAPPVIQPAKPVSKPKYRGNAIPASLLGGDTSASKSAPIAVPSKPLKQMNSAERLAYFRSRFSKLIGE